MPIREGGCKPGLALNPGTSEQVLQHLLPVIGHVVLMSVNPGFSGQSFISHTLTRLPALKTLLQSAPNPMDLMVDGGVSTLNIKQRATAGANIFIAGNAIFSSGNYSETIAETRAELIKSAN